VTGVSGGAASRAAAVEGGTTSVCRTARASGEANAAAAREEAELLQRLRAGDRDGFRQLVEQHGGNMLATARRVLRHEADAQDAVQSAFLSAYKALPAFDGRSRLGTWLHRIVVNAALMRRRTLKRHPEQELGELLPTFDHSGHFNGSPRRWSEMPDDALQRRELAAQVRQAIEALPEAYRVALLLRDIEELSNDEVAEQLGVTVNAAKIRVHRARQALRTLLAPRFAD